MSKEHKLNLGAAIKKRWKERKEKEVIAKEKATAGFDSNVDVREQIANYIGLP